MLEVLAASSLVMLASLSGKLVVWREAGPVIERNLHFFVSFAAGVLLVVTYNLAAEIAEHTGSIVSGLPWIIVGALVVLVAFRFMPSFHHHHDAEAHDHAHTMIDANRVLLSDGIHNCGHGVVIAVSSAGP